MRKKLQNSSSRWLHSEPGNQMHCVLL